MKILLLGKNGQVGWELQRALAPLGEVVALDRRGTDGLHGDLEDLQGLEATVRKLAPGIIVNAAAYTAVDKAETDEARARRINADAVRVKPPFGCMRARKAHCLPAVLFAPHPHLGEEVEISRPGIPAPRFAQLCLQLVAERLDVLVLVGRAPQPVF